MLIVRVGPLHCYTCSRSRLGLCALCALCAISPSSVGAKALRPPSNEQPHPTHTERIDPYELWGSFDKKEMCGKIVRNFWVPVSQNLATGNNRKLDVHDF